MAFAASSQEGYNWGQQPSSQPSQPAASSREEFIWEDRYKPQPAASLQEHVVPPKETRHEKRVATRKERRKKTSDEARKTRRKRGTVRPNQGTVRRNQGTDPLATLGKRSATANHSPQANDVQEPLTLVQQIQENNKELRKNAIEIEALKRKSREEKHSTTLKRARSKSVTPVTPVNDFTGYLGSSQSI
jgi:hypothetical protein